MQDITQLPLPKKIEEQGRSSPVHPSAALRARVNARSTSARNQAQSILIRDVAEQAKAATAALKSDSRARTPPLHHRKSTKSLKATNISAPHLISSSAKLDFNNLVNVAPEEELTEKQLRKTSSSAGLRQKMLKRFDSKANLPPSADEITPFNPAEFTKSSPNLLASPDPSLQSPKMLQSTSSSPRSPNDASPRMHRSGSAGSIDGNHSGLNRLLSRFKKRKDSQDSSSGVPLPSFLSERSTSTSPPLPSVTSPVPSLESRMNPGLGLQSPPLSAGRTPVTYDVSSRRKRAGSSSAENSPLPPVPPSPAASTSSTRKPAPTSRDSWVPPDPEASAASWRLSTASRSPPTPEKNINRDTAEESLRKLRQAAEALGLDSSKVDQLVDEARKSSTSPTSMPKIDEEESSEFKVPVVVRRTVILAADPTIQAPSRQSSLMRRSLTLTESSITKPPLHRRNTSEASIMASSDIRGPLTALKSVKDRAPTVSFYFYLKVKT